MRTIQTLLKADTYLDGSPVYKGDINRAFTSSLVFRVDVSVVKAPEGAKLLSKADDKLTQVMRKLKFGQVGALKSSEVEISSNETVLEVIIPVKRDDVLIAKDSLLTVFNIQSFMNERTCTINGTPVKLSKLKEELDKYRQANSEIRQRWVKRVQSLRARGASSDVIQQQKKESYAEYVSISEYTVAVNVSLTHVVNKPSLKSTVVGNVDEAYYSLVNYDEGPVRKVAHHRNPIVSIPIVTLEDYTESINYLNSLLKVTPELKQLKAMGMEDVYHETGMLRTPSVDWAALREHDRKVR
jgi:hypothetical protein